MNKERLENYAKTYFNYKLWVFFTISAILTTILGFICTFVILYSSASENDYIIVEPVLFFIMDVIYIVLAIFFKIKEIKFKKINDPEIQKVINDSKDKSDSDEINYINDINQQLIVKKLFIIIIPIITIILSTIFPIAHNKFNNYKNKDNILETINTIQNELDKNNISYLTNDYEQYLIEYGFVNFNIVFNGEEDNNDITADKYNYQQTEATIEISNNNKISSISFNFVINENKTPEENIEYINSIKKLLFDIISKCNLKEEDSLFGSSSKYKTSDILNNFELNKDFIEKFKENNNYSKEFNINDNNVYAPYSYSYYFYTGSEYNHPELHIYCSVI